jgi:hypothetical protein
VKNADRFVAPCFQLRTGSRCTVSFPELQDLRGATRSLSELAAYSETVANLSDDRTFPEQVYTVWVTANLFGMLEYRPVLGRDFIASDERSGAEPVIIISYDVGGIASRRAWTSSEKRCGSADKRQPSSG